LTATHTEDLREMFRHNTWANERVMSLCTGMDPCLLATPVTGTRANVHKILVHLVWVEVAYLWMIGRFPPAALQRRRSLEGSSMSGLGLTLARAGRGYLTWLEHAGHGELSQPVPVQPRADASLTTRRALLHVLTHSATHRAQVLASLASKGVAVPDLDYLRMVQEQALGGRPRENDLP
jgi:uncharacterized damage-inducible protein DinB